MGSPRRQPRRRKGKATIAAAVAAAIGSAASLSASATPQPTAWAAGAGPIHRVLVGRHAVNVGGVRLSFRMPADGWDRFGSISVNKSIVGPQGAEAMIFWASFPGGGGVARPCTRLLSPRLGRSAAEIASAVSHAPGTELVSGPKNVTVSGRSAKHVVLTASKDVGCKPGFFYRWRDVAGGPLWTETNPGDTIRVWIVAVKGMRLFIAAETTPHANAELEREIEQIVESIRFG